MANEVPHPSLSQPKLPHQQTGDERWVDELKRQGTAPRLPGMLRRILGEKISSTIIHALKGFPPQSAIKAHRESQATPSPTTPNQRR